MTPETLERLAREAGAFTPGRSGDAAASSPWIANTEDLARFAALVRAQALEEAAEQCEFWDASHPIALAAAIRALKEQP